MLHCLVANLVNPAYCLSLFDHFLGLTLKRVNTAKGIVGLILLKNRVLLKKNRYWSPFLLCTFSLSSLSYLRNQYVRIWVRQVLYIFLCWIFVSSYSFEARFSFSPLLGLYFKIPSEVLSIFNIIKWWEGLWTKHNYQCWSVWQRNNLKTEGWVFTFHLYRLDPLNASFALI